ncbi:MAG: YfhO family protein [Candidatus Methylomirabilia bacterium]
MIQPPPARRPRSLLPYLAILGVAVVFFAPFLFQGKIFLAADTLFQFYPWRSPGRPEIVPHNRLITDPVNASYPGLYNRQLKEGVLRSWNPYIMTGIPMTAVTAMSGAPGRYLPPRMLLHRFLPAPTAEMIVLIAYVLCMGFSMYLYLREVGAAPAGALFGAVAWMFNGCAMVWLEFVSVAATAAFLPFLFLAMERYHGTRRLAAASGGALVLGLIGLMGQLQYIIYTALMMVFYLLFLLVRTWREGGGRREAALLVGCFALTALGGVMISAVELLPVADLMSHSGRISRSFGFQQFFDTLSRVPWRYFVTLVFPDFFGSPPLGLNVIPSLPTQEYMNYNELCLYMGVPTAVILVAGLAAPKNPAARFHLALTVILALMLAGTVVYYPFFALFPGMNKMNPSRLIFLFSFSFAASAGLFLGNLGDLSKKRKVLCLILIASLAVLALAVGLTASTAGSVLVFSREAVATRGVQAQNLLGALRSASSAVIAKPLVILGCSAVLVTALVLSSRRTVALAASAGLVALLGYDLITFGWGYNTLVERRQIYPTTPGIAFLLKQPRPFRVVLDGQRGLFVNSFMPFGIEEVGGYSSFYPARANQLLSFVDYGPQALQGVAFDRWVIIKNVLSPVLEMMNVRYLVTAPTIKLEHPGYRLAYRGEVAIYENLRAMPRAYAVHRYRVERDPAAILRQLTPGNLDPRREVLLEKEPGSVFLSGTAGPGRPPEVVVAGYEDDRISVDADLAANGWLVVSNTFHPGWRAVVDGRPAGVQRANGNFCAVPLEAGKHRVELSFVSISRRWGLAFTLAGLACAAAGLVFFTRGNVDLPAEAGKKSDREGAPPGREEPRKEKLE